MDHVLKHQISKENCGHDESQGKRTFEAFQASNVRKLLWSKSAEERHETDLTGFASILDAATYAKRNPGMKESFSISLQLDRVLRD